MDLLPNTLFTQPSGGTRRRRRRTSPPKLVKFPNGMRFVYEKSPSDLPLTSIQCFVHVGSANERDGTRGISHLLEHMCFKGTKKIPISKDISLIYDKTGAYINAYTVKQLTCYIIKCQSEFIDTSVKVLSDMMFHSIFDRDEFTKEYNVVIEEAKKFADDNYNTVEEAAEEFIYKDSSYENPIDSLVYHTRHRIKYEDMIEFYKTYYVPENMVLSIVSSLDYSAVLRAVKHSYFSAAAPHAAAGAKVLPTYNLKDYSEPQFLLKKKSDIESLIIGIGFRTCNMYSSDKYILNLLKFILVGPSSSYFFNELRNNNGLTYSTSISISNYEHTGHFIIYTQVTKEKLIKNGSRPGLLPITFDILKKLKTHGITKTDLETAKGFLKGVLSRNLADNDNLADHNGIRTIFYADRAGGGGAPAIYSYKEKYNRFYRNITQKDINAAFKKYFCAENLSVVILGSPNSNETAAKIKKTFEDL
jgi:predicted Zn-dependent peptidase